MRKLLLSLALLALVAPLAVAASRTWTSANGKHTIDAEILDFKDGKVHLKQSDGGKVIEVPLGSLCDADRDFVKKQYPGVQEEQFRPGADYREWKSGKYSVLAEFLACQANKVHLRKADGTEIAVELAKLSPEDQSWVKDELKRLRESEKDEAAAAAQANAKADEKIDRSAPQNVSLGLVKLDPPGGVRAKGPKSKVPSEFYLRQTDPINFFMQISGGGGGGGDDPLLQQFQRIVQKEPAYKAPKPFKAAATLAGQEFAFALDADGKAAGYNLLYFDRNRNGDLTDEKPIPALAVNAIGGSISQSQFPRVDVPVEVDSKPGECAVLLGALVRKGANEAYATVSMHAAAIREGFLGKGTRKTHLVLVDHNSNGLFGDTVQMRQTGYGLSPGDCDLLLVNPDTRDMLSRDATMGRDRHFVSKTVCIGKEFFKLEVAPAGENLTLTPTELAIGHVRNASPAYRAVVYSDDYGVMMIGGTKDQKIPLPEGQWKVANYTIDATGLPGLPRKTAISARFGEDSPTTTVVKGESAAMSFGAPFHALVQASREGNRVYLSLDIVGAAGERCTSFYVNGVRPPEPRFVVKDKDGKSVHQGSFEYG